MDHTSRNPGLAALLSFFVPGIGQIYTGHFIWAVFWLIITSGSWIMTAGFCSWPFHILASWQAYRQAEEHNARLLR